MTTDPIMAAAFRKRPEHELKSPVFNFLWDRYDTYGKRLAERGVDWDHMAAELAREGVMNGHGEPPTGKVVRATFYKVRDAKTGRKKKRRPVVGKQTIKRKFARSAAQ